MEDSQIVSLLKSDPPRGLEEAIQKYRGYVGAIAARVLETVEEDVEECVSDTFVSVWKYIRQGNEIHNLKGCIACTARNLALNRLKQRKRSNVVELGELELESEQDMALEFESEENLRAIQELVYRLDEPDREIFVRKYFLMESLKEISRRTALDEIQIRNRLYRCRQKLRKQLEERGAAV